jgi:hypothetical protein
MRPPQAPTPQKSGGAGLWIAVGGGLLVLLAVVFFLLRE